MRVLFLNPYLPFPLTSGDNIRSFSLMSRVCRKHPVTAIVYSSQETAKPLDALREFCDSYYQIQQKRTDFSLSAWFAKRKLPKPVREFYQTSMRKTVRYLLERHAFDLIHCGHAALTPLIPADAGIPVVLQVDSLEEHALFARMAVQAYPERTPTPSQIAPWLGAMCERVDRVILPSASEQQSLAAFAPGAKSRIVPHGIDTREYRHMQAPKTGKTLVLTGSMDQNSNIDAVNRFHAEIFPALRKIDPELRVFVVGRRPPETLRRLNRHRNVVVTGEVVDIRPFLGGATIAVFPQTGGGTAAVKILEALAMEVPVVCSPGAIENLALRHEQHLLVAGSTAEFASAVGRLLRDGDFRAELASRGRAHVERVHSWDAVATNLIGHYRECLAPQSADPASETDEVTQVDVPAEKAGASGGFGLEDVGSI